MDTNGVRDKALDRFLRWKKETMPSLINEVESGYLIQIRLLRHSYDPTQLENDRFSGEELDHMLKQPVSPLRSSPLRSPKRIIKLKDLEDISSEELDYEDHTDSSSSYSSSSSSSSSSTSSSDSRIEPRKNLSTGTRKRKRAWKVSHLSSSSDSGSENESSVPEKKNKLVMNDDENNKSKNTKKECRINVVREKEYGDKKKCKTKFRCK
ncbi:uncharacterized protein LOC132733438 [Ruditapes philippinarum]|uniref:uncharacterized protein LOC132733438 n=1 Tax=Ruditapes philippinarum TaxID=129788 RepID=UPI00295B86A5|nr:uncharacterized protein LOC132733438 [Ruditapes philippinarum]